MYLSVRLARRATAATTAYAALLMLGFLFLIPLAADLPERRVEVHPRARAGDVPGALLDAVGYLMAASVVVLLPCRLIFFLAQRSFIEGITLTGMKG